jgi:hypothetical protein
VWARQLGSLHRAGQRKHMSASKESVPHFVHESPVPHYVATAPLDRLDDLNRQFLIVDSARRGWKEVYRGSRDLSGLSRESSVRVGEGPGCDH